MIEKNALYIFMFNFFSLIFFKTLNDFQLTFFTAFISKWFYYRTSQKHCIKKCQTIINTHKKVLIAFNLRGNEKYVSEL